MSSPIEQALMDLRAAEQAQDSAEALEIVKASLDKLSDDDRRKLLIMPAVNKLLNDAEQRARESITPGTIVCDAQGRVISRIPETWEHMWKKAEEEDDFIEWSPMQTRLIMVQGVDLQVFQGRRMRTPKIFYDVAMEAFNAEQNFLQTTKDIVKRNFGENGMVLHGDGTPA